MQICFDLDGTIVDVSDRHYDVYSKATAKLSGKPLSKKDYWQLKRQKADWPTILKKSTVDTYKASEFLKRFIDLIEQPSELSKDRLFADTIKVLESISDQHVLYLVSLRRSEKNLIAELKRLGIRHYFKNILVSHTENEGFELKKQLIESLNLFKTAIVVGDTEADIKAAHSLGLKSVGVTSGMRNKKLIAGLKPTYVAKGITALPKIIDDLSED